MNRRLFVLAALALTGCATAGPPVSTPAPSRAQTHPPAVFAELEPLYAVDARRDGMAIRVASNGCTAKGDFAFFVERKGEVVTLAFGRKRVDTCRSFAMGHADLIFTWAELGLTQRTPIFLLNPLTAWTGP
jgi:hypothetical protein